MWPFGHGVLLVATLLVQGALVPPAHTQPRTLDARIVWVQGTRIYLVSSDSLALAPRDHLTVIDRGRVIAKAAVTSVHDSELAVASLLSGSLARVKKLERLRIVVDRPPVLSPTRLRVGIPSSRRDALLFRCEPMTLRVPGPEGLYHVEIPGAHHFRLVRQPDIPTTAPWPDTLDVQLFDESADQEIALERGDLDVAVFWPGELSTHLQRHPRFDGGMLELRSRGVLAAVPVTPSDTVRLSPADRRALADLYGEVFHAPFDGTARDSSTTALPRARFEVDPGCPARERMERVLNRGLGPRRTGDTRRVIRLTFLDEPRDDAAGHGAQALRMTHPTKFGVGCRVVCAPDLRHLVGVLGLADLPACGSAGRP